MGTLEDVVSCDGVRTTKAGATVLEAVKVMCDWHVRAVVVGEPADPVGILCERDILERVVLRHLDPATTPVEAVMTRPLFQLPIDCSPSDALQYLREHRVHQVPVAGDEGLVGVVSSSDLRQWALRNLESEVDALTSYVMLGR
jgi:CBS domain-containing protein